MIKGGFGVFHDLGFGHVAGAYTAYPFIKSKTVAAPEYPLTADTQAPPSETLPETILAMDRELELPYTNQWNVTIEQALGSRQTMTVSYVGADGNRLLKQERYLTSLAEPQTTRTQVFVNRNRGLSDYRALQMQFHRRLSAGLQSLVSYTFGQSRDTSSSDSVTSIPAEKIPAAGEFGFSDFDVRHAISAAVTYQVSGLVRGPGIWRLMADGWGIDMMLRARSALPLNVSATVAFPPDTQTARPNVIPGQPFWLEDPTVPGGRRVNRAAFSAPAPETQGTLPRGVVRGFSARQVDLALRRGFKLPQNVQLQLRFEMFNVFNIPNFFDPSGNIASASFGVSQQMLGRGFGGLNPFYQIGGPRSTQLAVKMLF
jgi:hypothetical protein